LKLLLGLIDHNPSEQCEIEMENRNWPTELIKRVLDYKQGFHWGPLEPHIHEIIRKRLREEDERRII